MKKKKILLFSDDMRMSSGVGTMSREIIVGTAHHFDWVQVGGAIKHPEPGQMFDLSKDKDEEFDPETNLRNHYNICFVFIVLATIGPFII